MSDSASMNRGSGSKDDGVSVKEEPTNSNSNSNGSNGSNNNNPGTNQSLPAAPAPAPAMPPQTTSKPIEEQGAVSRVNGIGLWNSWTRNFRNPFMAFMDLMDNAIDATILPTPVTRGKSRNNKKVVNDDNNKKTHMPFPGRIECFMAETSAQNNNIIVNPKTVGRDICVRNNCFKAIQPLVQVLEVFKSTKTQSCVGENGVGVKQACAALSDLSIILTRNAEIHKYSIGILNRGLQREEGCVLPSYFFELGSSSQKQELDTLFRDYLVKESARKEVALLFAKNLDQLIETQSALRQSLILYGSQGADVNQSRREALMSGRGKLIRHLCQLSGWTRNDTHTFYTILTDIKDARALLEEIRLKLPEYYIHVPKSLRVTVERERIKFQFWERRLTDLTQFDTRIDTKNCAFLSDSQDWDWPDNGYDLRIFIGFDPIRSCQRMASQLSMYIYTRRSGRLIKREEDGRKILGLGNSGTKYGQGLTVIIDDFENNLQLTPTKQDISFATEAYGDIHRNNLYAWISGYCDMYYQWYEDYYVKKGILGDHVKEMVNDVQHLAQQEFSHTLMEGDFNGFDKVKFKRTQLKNIRCCRRKELVRVLGNDAIVQMIRQQGFERSKLLPPLSSPSAAAFPRESQRIRASITSQKKQNTTPVAAAATTPRTTTKTSTTPAASARTPAAAAAPPAEKKRPKRTASKSTSASAKKRKRSPPVETITIDDDSEAEANADDSALKDELLQRKESQIRKLQQSVDKLRDEKKQLQDRRNSRSNRMGMNADLNEIHKQNCLLEKEMIVMTGQLDDLNKKYKASQQALSDKEEEIAKLKQQLATRGKSMGGSNQDEELKTLRKEVTKLKSFNSILTEESEAHQATMAANQATIKKLKEDLKRAFT